MNSNFLSRIRFFSVFIFLFAGVLITKLFFVQVVHSASYAERADGQYATPSSDIFDRGSIFFKTKDGNLVSAATIKAGFKVAIHPNKISDPQALYEELNKIIELDEETFLKRASKKNDPYEEVATKISKIDADTIDEQNLTGVSIFKQKWRFYPGESLASNSLGFVAFNDDDLSGRYGLERFYNDVLGRASEELYVNFFAEIFTNLNSVIFNDDERDGDIITTIEPSVQSFLETTLFDLKDKWGSESAGGIIINPTTGAIYAMANVPNFDLNNFSDVSSSKIFTNPLVENVFEYGSIIKPLVMAAGLDAGVITSETEYFDKGFVVVEDSTINNFDKKGRGLVTMQDVLNQSLNTGSVFVMNKLGRTDFKKYLLSYGIGEKTGIDLPSETSGLVSNLNSKRDIEYATASFGQGIALTPVEAVRAFSVLANGGKLITPHLVEKIDYRGGGTKELTYDTEPVQVIKPETSEEISRMLATVADISLPNKDTHLSRYNVAVKTGTAQIANLNEGGYYDDRHLHSLFGYFPAYNPEFLVLLYNVYPKNVRYSVQTLGDPFLETTRFLLNYYNVAPDR
ncbi:hypothetical protein COB64_02915 [Candidatus Wolfebacteria bacterium]|nr:MAG: hypothetical protein COB64_02915 [Candidatus Wolfebacteria bacterium]